MRTEDDDARYEAMATWAENVAPDALELEPANEWSRAVVAAMLTNSREPLIEEFLKDAPRRPDLPLGNG